MREFTMHNLSRRNAICLALLAGRSPFAASLPSAAQEKVPLAIKGYDPVAYFTARKTDARAAGDRI